jgi:serine/threonine-protein kinase HipA
VTAVWLYGTRLGALRFDFDPAAVERWGNGAPILSTSMLVSAETRPTGDIVAAFFQNLLPEGNGLTTLRTLYQAFDDLALLQAIGRDTAGALVIADDPTSAAHEPRYLDLDEIARRIAHLPERPLGASPTIRHSLAGVQHKLLLGRSADGRWYEPSAAWPSTHLLKPAPLDHGEIADNEAFCMAVARSAGLATCTTEILSIGAARILVAQRYDRVGADRIHQEDGCQMLGLPPTRKYHERRAGGKSIGPSLAGIAAWLSPADRVRLLESHVLNVLVGNADCHGKNISVLHLPDGSLRLAPLYDVMSTVVHHPLLTVDGPRPLTRDLGMRIGTARTLDDVTLDDLMREAASWPIGRDHSIVVIRQTIELIVAASAAHATEYPAIAQHVAQTADRLLA